MKESLVANKWYPCYKGPNKIYRNRYPTPQSILRQAVGSEDYSFVSETVTSEHIRAAVVMPSAVPFQHLLDPVPWSMTYITPEWRMLVVSVLDPLSWIELARASGAIAWYKSHSQTYTYNWEPPTCDPSGNKIRPPNAPGIDTTPSIKMSEVCNNNYKKKYNLAEVVADIKKNYLTTKEIGFRHDISSSTVQKIAKQAGIKLPRGPK